MGILRGAGIQQFGQPGEIMNGAQQAHGGQVTLGPHHAAGQPFGAIAKRIGLGGDQQRGRQAPQPFGGHIVAPPRFQHPGSSDGLRPGDMLGRRPGSFVAWLIGSLIAIGAPSAHAADPSHPAVVELFQSQGCSSCPPANAKVNALSQPGDVLALSFAVTYWDRLGWKDTFAKPQFTERQWQYARAMREQDVHTPQVVVNGRVAGVGADPGEI